MCVCLVNKANVLYSCIYILDIGPILIVIESLTTFPSEPFKVYVIQMLKSYRLICLIITLCYDYQSIKPNLFKNIWPQFGFKNHNDKHSIASVLSNYNQTLRGLKELF